MKMKKIVLLFSMIAVLFSMTGCSDGQEKVSFEYTETDIISSTLYQAYQFQNPTDAYRAYLADSEEELAKATLTGISNFDTIAEECGEFEGYRSKDGDSIEFDFNSITNAQDEESYYAAVAAYTSFLSNVDATVSEDGDNVVVEIKAVYSKCDAIYTFRYEENSAYAYSEELLGQSANPYQIQEVTASPDYSFGEKMAKAGMNTLMGMGTVFAVLLFIAFIIGQFERIDKALVAFSNWCAKIGTKIRTGWANRKNKSDETPDEVVQESVVNSASVDAPVAVNPMDDSQLVAVITAAVVAASTAAGSTDKLIVRSIKKAKR